MKNLTHRIIPLTALICIIFFSCKKVEGPAGPTGPQGPAGPGAVKSVTVDVIASDWVYTTGVAQTEKNVPEITESVFNKGSVDVFWQISGAWVALPFTFPTGPITQTMGYGYLSGKLRISVTNSDGTTPANLNTATFKVAIAEGV